MIDKAVLINYCELIDEISDIETRINKLSDDIKRLQKRIEGIENGEFVVDKVKGGEGGWQGYIIEGVPVPEYEKCKTVLLTKKCHIENEYALLADRKLELFSERTGVQRFICGIRNPATRRIVTFRCMDHMKWSEVAKSMGNGYTEESVKQVFCRFLKKEFGKK